MRRQLSAVLVAMLLPLGCLGTPQPDPPNVDPERIVGVGTFGPEIEFDGEPGAVTPPEAALRIYPLDRDDPPVDVTLGDDGSFHAVVPGDVGEEFRFQARLDDDRAPPVDLIVRSDSVELAPRPLADCLTVSSGPLAFLRAGERTTLELRNDCADRVTLDRIAVRRPAAPFTVVSPAAPLDVPPGGRQPVIVEASPPGAEPAEEVLVLDVSAPVDDRRPVTLIRTP